MDVTPHDIDQVITEMWGPAFELDLHPTDTETGERHHTMLLAVLGGWEGLIVVAATDSFARAVASKMFGRPRAEVGAADAADAVGELANVVAGNIKSLLAEEELDLGLPVDGDAWDGSGDELVRTTLAVAPGFEVTVSIVVDAAVPASA